MTHLICLVSLPLQTGSLLASRRNEDFPEETLLQTGQCLQDLDRPDRREETAEPCELLKEAGAEEGAEPDEEWPNQHGSLGSELRLRPLGPAAAAR